MRDSIVRSYIRSNMPRMQWTDDRHYLFVQVVEILGGEELAKPKKILNLMGANNITLSQVKSHLQMYRNKKKEKAKQEMRMMWQMYHRQSQQYVQIYENLIRDVVQIEESPEMVNPMVVSCKSLYQSCRVGLNENRGHDVVVAEDGANGEEDMSLELTLGLKY
ncbi:putative Myb family transcription factor At1g14600 [Capsella rubella]|uniref:putative Myb family transcription factor At1g14600 n=1 Tax=Capsella rubella TaxID=81985 RepID=UPI000CD54939|nr:putative Myb family transcription factor At1g14600 [Capsella rubella]